MENVRGTECVCEWDINFETRTAVRWIRAGSGRALSAVFVWTLFVVRGDQIEVRKKDVL